MTLSKIVSLSVRIAAAAALGAACSSSTLSRPGHDSGSDTPVVSKVDSGHDGPTNVPTDGASDQQVSPRDSGPDATSGVGGCSGHAPAPPEVPAQHRATAAACPATAFFFEHDAGTCTSKTDCATDIYNPPSCLRGQCSPDECLTDADCAPNEVCDCNAHVQAPAQSSNLCVPANCHVDADCGPGGFCSPTYVACGYLAGYYCHRPTDNCYNNTDCACGQTCQYTPAAGAFSCTSPGLCAG